MLSRAVSPAKIKSEGRAKMYYIFSKIPDSVSFDFDLLCHQIDGRIATNTCDDIKENFLRLLSYSHCELSFFFFLKLIQLTPLVM